MTTKTAGGGDEESAQPMDGRPARRSGPPAGRLSERPLGQTGCLVEDWGREIVHTTVPAGAKSPP